MSEESADFADLEQFLKERGRTDLLEGQTLLGMYEEALEEQMNTPQDIQRFYLRLSLMERYALIAQLGRIASALEVRNFQEADVDVDMPTPESPAEEAYQERVEDWLRGHLLHLDTSDLEENDDSDHS